MSRRLRLLLIALVATAVLAAAGVAAFPEIVRRVVAWKIAGLTGRAVTLAAVEVDLFRGRVALRDLRVTDRDRRPLATIESLRARLRVRDLLRGHVHVTEAAIQSPALRIVRTGPGEFNVSDLLARKSAGGPAPALTLEHLDLRDGTVAIEDRTLAPPRAWRVEAVTLEVRGVSTLPGAAPGTVTVAAVAAGSPVSLWVSGVRLAPLRFHATAIAREIDASLAALYLPPGSALSPVRGTLDASATVEQDAAGARASLDAVFGGVELRPPGRAGTVVSWPAVRVTVEDLRIRAGAVELRRLAVDGGRAVLEDARLAPVRRWQAEGIAVEARNLSSARDAPPGVGTARAIVAGSPVSVWVANLRLAPVELDATVIVRGVDFALFRLYVPPGLPVQPERGVVNATVRIDHRAGRGTRLTLDAGLDGVEVRRPAHFVTAPALHVTAEDIAFGAGAVTVGHVAVGGDRLTIEDRTLRPPRRWPVRDLAVEATGLSSRRRDVQGVVTGRATVAGATVSAWVTHVRLDPLELRATAILRDLDLALVQLYLPAPVPVQLERGVVNASVQVDHDVAGGMRLTGDVTLSGVQAGGRGATVGLAASLRSLRVALARVSRHEGTLGVGRLELTATEARVDTGARGGQVDLERLRLAGEGLTWPVRGPARVELSARLRDGGEVEASGTALLTAPPPMIAWTTDLAVRLKAVDLAAVAAWLPSASGLGGRASANVTANVAYGASLTARVQGDARADRLALAEGGRRLLSVRRLDAAGLDVLWPERIGARRVRIERPRALIERDRRGVFPLRARLASPPAPVAEAPAAAPATPPERAPAQRLLPAVAVDEVVVERGRLAFVDARAAPDGAPARLDLPRIDVTLRDARWPASGPARLRLDAALPDGGTVTADGSVTIEPAAVDLKVVLADARLAPLQPYLPFRAGLRGHVDASLTIAGPVAPAPRLSARGEATLRDLVLADGARQVLTLERLGATGIDATWPGSLDIARIRARRSWALIERDAEGRFLLRTLLGRPAGVETESPAPGSPPPATPAGRAFELRLGEGLFEDGAATIVDAVTTPPARFEVAGARLAVQDLTWPPRGPVKLQVTAPMPGGGRLDAGGTLDLEPVRLQARATLDGMQIAPAQPYLPIEGRVTGQVSADLSVSVAVEPIAVQVRGQARLQRFRLSDGNRALVTAGRLEASGIDVDWPRRVAVERVRLRRPSLLIERDATGDVALPRLVTPRRVERPPGPAAPAPAEPAASRPGRALPAIEIGTLGLERAYGRFVDQTTSPPYAEELPRVDLTVTGLTTVAGRPAHFTGSGSLGGGGTFTLEGEGAASDPPRLELKVDVRGYPIPRANPYLDRFVSWTATRGTLAASARYTLHGTRLDAHHDIVVRGLDVVRSGASDEVERRLGLPLGFLVALLKDARGEVHLSVPVSGDIATRQFDFREAAWGAVRALAIRLLALPFSRVGSLFFSEDSRVQGVALAPAVFDAGTARLPPATVDHLDRIADFLGQSPALTVRLVPILTQADLDALKRDGEPVSDDAVRALAARRLQVVREALTAHGVASGRLEGSARRVALVEAAGDARVEFDLRP